MKTAMIWGASGGIGRALTKKLADDGWTVVAIGRNLADVEDLTPHTARADIASPYEVEVAVTTAAQQVREVDLFIYAAGDIISEKVADMSSNTWRRILNANLTGAFLTTRFSAPLLAKDAHLVYVGAISENLRLPGLSAYAAAKAGLEAFVDALGKEERKRRVTIVRPGAVDTPLWDKVPMDVPKKAMTPEVVAGRIVEAHQDGHKGTLDIT